jgi:hypothetical protein
MPESCVTYKYAKKTTPPCINIYKSVRYSNAKQEKRKRIFDQYQSMLKERMRENENENEIERTRRR